MQYRACNTRPSVIYSTYSILFKDFSVSNRPPRWLIALIVLISLPLLLPFLYVIERAADVGLARSIELLWRPRMWELLSNTLLFNGICYTFCHYSRHTMCIFIRTLSLLGKRLFPSSHDAPSLYSSFCQLFYVDQSHLQSRRLVGNHRYYDAEFFSPLAYLLSRRP